MSYILHPKGEQATALDYIRMIAAVKPVMSHPGSPCPADTQRFVLAEACLRFPDDPTIKRMQSADGQGRSCESGELHYLATKRLGEERERLEQQTGQRP